MLPELTLKNARTALNQATDTFDKLRGEKVLGENTFVLRGPETTIQFHVEGLGDMMILRQFERGFQAYLRENEDPGLGKVVVACGSMLAAFHPDRGDINLLWWYSFGRKDDAPDEFLPWYLNEATVVPDAILCPSPLFQEEAERLGFDTLYFPIGVQGFEPLGQPREGLGYAGSKNHKGKRKVEMVIGPHETDPDFEHVSHFVSPTQLNLWYNTKLATFGLTKEGQRRWGNVNSRVFETLASGTPLILEEHPYLEDVLGFEYPYQSSSREETIELVDRIRSDPEAALDEFETYSERVRENHSYERRVETLFDYLTEEFA